MLINYNSSLLNIRTNFSNYNYYSQSNKSVWSEVSARVDLPL